MVWVWLTIGMLFRTIQVSVCNFKKHDPLTILVALGAGLLMVGEAMQEADPGDEQEAWIMLPIVFVAAIAFFFKDRILPVITEGTLFGYALVAGYIYLSNVYAGGQEIGVLSLLFFSGCLGLTLFLVLDHRVADAMTQTLLMVLFICLNIYIGYEMTKGTATFAGSFWEVILIGYSCMILLANVVYVLMFIPVKGKYQSYADRIREIKAHARDLEEKYLEVNSTSTQTLLTIVLFAVLLCLEYLNLMRSEVLVSIVLTFMLLVHAPAQKEHVA